MPYSSTVSVIITTQNRPDLLPRAIASAFAQTHPPIEIVVVADGADDDTLATLQGMTDHRLRTIILQHPVGGATARNLGVDAAQGDWIAFLDDDDEWLPEKLQAQLKMAARSHAQYPVIACRVRAQSPRGRSWIWPRRKPAPGEHLSDYLLARNTITQGEGLITTSMLLAPRALFTRTRFTNGLRRHQEWDWLLRASASAEVEVILAWAVLAVWHIEAERPSISSTNEWQTSFQWIAGMRRLVTPRAYASFLLVFVSAIAARERDYAALLTILHEVRKHGRPAKIDGILAAGMWLMPQKTRRKVRSLLIPSAQHA